MADGINLKMRMSGDEKVRRDMKKTGKSASMMGRGVAAASTKLTAMGAAFNPVTAGLAAAAAGLVAAAAAAKITKDAFVATIRSTLALADELDTITKKAQSIGATNTDIQLVSNAMALFGVETNATIKATQKFNQALGQAMLPNAPKTLTEAFGRLGMSARELAALPLRERFIAIAQGFATYENQATRAADASLLFGRMGKDALTAFSQGGQAMEDAIADVERYGIASDLAFQNSEHLVDAQFRLELAFNGLKTQALEPLMPVLEGVAQGLADTLAGMDDEQVRQFGVAFSGFLKRIVIGTAAAAPALEAVTAAVVLFGKAQFKVAGIMARLFLPGFTAVADMVGVGIDLSLEKSDKKWDSWADSIISSIDKAQARAAETMIGPAFGPEPPPGTPSGGNGGKGGKGGGTSRKVDPLAALKKEKELLAKDLDMYRQSLKSKEEVLLESLERRQEVTRQLQEAGLLSDQEADLMRIEFARQVDDQLLAMEQERARKTAEIRDQELAEEQARLNQSLQRAQERAAKDKAREEKYLLDQQSAAIATLDATGSFAQSISQMVSATMGENSEEAKKAAQIAFGVQQASSLAQATILMALAIAQASAAAPSPLNVPGIIQASVTGAAQIAAITAATISGVADAGLPPGALRSAGLNQHTVLAVRNDEMVLDPVGTAAISRMLEQRATGQGQPIMVNASVEIDGEVLGRSVDNHLVRSSERGLGYERRIRY
tara:strand:+ start:355 stop:2523 length:2169 start_codon:yes stop_codon:yes gene_type:complete